MAVTDRDTGGDVTQPAAGAPRFYNAPTQAARSEGDSGPVLREPPSAASDVSTGVVPRTSPERGPAAPRPGDPRAPLQVLSHLPPPEARQSPPREPSLRAPQPGERFGESLRFEIVERLGAGGMGHVFRAHDHHLDRTVAVKFILDNGGMPLEQLITMLRREAKATAKLNHENIVAIFDMDAFEGAPFLVMELLDGQSLDALLGRSRLHPLRATQIMLQVARGLAHAHKNGIVHRDLKPSNVFLLRDGRAKILDFGISRFERSAVAQVGASDAGPTISGVGTPAFMAPEQWRGEPQDARADIWAAGVMFHEMLTGRLPYTVPELLLKFRMRARVRSLAPSVRLLVPTLPEEADRIVATALCEDPPGRYQSASELADALRELEKVLGGSAAVVATRAGPQVERRPLTLLSCCLTGLDGLELDDAIELDHRFYRICAEAVRRWDGTAGTPIGGRLLCCFGHPVARETDAQRAVRAALQIAGAVRAQAEKESLRLELKLAVHSGIVGLPAHAGAAPGFPAMVGDVPGLAIRLSEGAAPGSVVMSQATLELTSGLFATAALPDGAAVPAGSRAHLVLGEVESASRFDPTFTAQLTPFVGRETELAFLRQLWDDAKEGRGQVVIVSGEPGIGKSRLVQSLKEQVIEERNTRLTCQCWPHFKNAPLHPVVELLLRSMDLQRDDTAEDRLRKLEDNLSPLGFDLAQAVPVFAPLLAVPFEGRHAPLGLTPEQTKVKTLDALVTMLQRTATNRPTLFIVEDVHWLDHSTQEFLNTLLDAVPASHLLVVLTCRPEYRLPWSARRHLHQIALDRLSSASTAAMIARASRDQELPADMVERLVSTADGVPLFIEELTRMVVESWQPRSGPPTGPQTTSRISIPSTLHELLLARLDRLSGPGKEVAQIGSILGRDFHHELVRGVALMDDISLQEGLDVLVGAGVLHHQGRPPEVKYVFRHALIQQTAYESMVKSERQRHHLRAAQVLAEDFKETADLRPELLAYHHAEAGNMEEAIACWEKAGQRATQRSALVEAIDHYTRAREALAALPEGIERDRKELALLLALGSPLMSVHGYATPEVERTYARARELARAAGGQADIFPAMQGLWQFYYVRGMLPTSRRLGEQLLEIAHEAKSSTFLLLAHRSIASSAFLQGDYSTCREHTTAGLAIYDMAQHGSLALRTGHDPGVAHGVYLAWSLWMLGHPDQSLARVLEMVELARRLAHPMTTAYALCFASLMRNHRGDHAEAKALADAALEITVPNKFALWTAWAKMQRGWALSGAGDFESGIPQMTEGLLGWKSTGARVGFTFFPVTLAEICLHAGRLDETERLLAEAAPMVEENDEHFYEPELLRLRGELALRTARDPAEAAAFAEGCFTRGIDVARRLGGKSWELRLAASRARLRSAGGDGAAALAALGDAYGWFTEGFGTADLRAARAQIDGAAAPPGPPA